MFTSHWPVLSLFVGLLEQITWPHPRICSSRNFLRTLQASTFKTIEKGGKRSRGRTILSKSCLRKQITLTPPSINVPEDEQHYPNPVCGEQITLTPPSITSWRRRNRFQFLLLRRWTPERHTKRIRGLDSTFELLQPRNAAVHVAVHLITRGLVVTTG